MEKDSIFTGTSFEIQTAGKAETETLNTLGKPPRDYDLFLAAATDTFVAKDTDYDSRFMRGMKELDAYTLWAWEVDKKLDRLRTWIQRGELLVKGEGVENSIQDLFVYSVQYRAFTEGRVATLDAGPLTLLHYWRRHKEAIFYETAASFKPGDWIKYLIDKERIAPNEYALQNFIKLYMGDRVNVTDWQQAIREILRG
ncbi:hypothetical protein HWB91_gp52 [Bacillus phage vB_BboS-125]|uniref:Uncharacterized protein n=1 Tax=Bacillus phage vB_BboS-125 TaxID=2419618 RepID=A0A3G3BVW4_9CAUD|nr:hypothetical protein HWB91_gp52 [Bacillus phage vB_BboS-125]AYP68422.1 hypothetical protein BboS125_00053 [Bacillus phage vB_BboS-125]